MNDTEKRRAFNKELTAQRRRLSRIRQEAIDGLTTTLQAALVRIRGVIGNSPSDFQSFLLPQLETQISEILLSVGNNSAEIVKQSLLDSWETGIQIIDAPLRQAGLAVSVLLPAIDTRQLLNMQTFGTGKIQSVSADIAAKINTQLGLTVLGAQSVDDSLTVITHLLDETDRERALRIVRTEMGRAYSSATQQRFGQASRVLPGLKKQWRKSGKIQARPSHLAANNQIRDVDDHFSIGGVPMLHPHDPAAPAAEVINCGCTALPYMESWDIATR